MLLGETFLYVLCVGSHLGRFHQLLNIRQRACEIRGTLGEPFLQMRVVLIVGCGYYDLVVLQLEAFSHVVHLCLNSAQSCLIFQYQFGISATEMSREQVNHTVERVEQRTEVEQFAHHRQIVVALQLAYLLVVRRVFDGVCGVFVNSSVAYDGLLGQGSAQHEFFERATTRQSHVGLTVCEGTLNVDDSLIERQSLALVYGYSPSRLDWELLEGAVNLLGYLVCFLVDFVSCVFPLVGLHLYHVAGVLGAHREVLRVDVLDGANHTVVVCLFSRRIVLDEHHLRTLLQSECLFGRKQHFGELARNLSLVSKLLARQQVELSVVLALRLEVVRHESYVSLVCVRLESLNVSGVERCQHRSVGMVVAYLIKYVEKALVVLSVNGLQLYDSISGALQGERREEVGRGIIARQ